MSGARWSGLATRALTAGVLLPTAIALLWLPSLRLGFIAFVTAIAVVGLHEYYVLVRALNLRAETIVGTFGGGAVTALAGFYSLTTVNAVLLSVCFCVVAASLSRPERNPAALTANVFGVAYVGWLSAHVLLIHALPEVGRGLTLALFAAVIATDTAAYFVGKYMGRHPLAPVLSPKKTCEGAMAGLGAATVAVVGLSPLAQAWPPLKLPDWPWWQYAAVGAGLSVAAQVGDLTKSSLKRAAGVKDSGTIFPGHGGVLDRCDGFLFAAPVLYYMAVL